MLKTKEEFKELSSFSVTNGVHIGDGGKQTHYIIHFSSTLKIWSWTIGLRDFGGIIGAGKSGSEEEAKSDISKPIRKLEEESEII